MKKIIIFFSIVLFSAAMVSAQAWHAKVKWDATSSNCNCDASIGSRYIVFLQITDVANNYAIPPLSVFANIDETEYTFNVEEAVKGHCDDLSNTYPPNYTIYAYVGFWCADTTPPELVCNGSNTDTGVSCFDFGSVLQTITVTLN